MDFAKKEMEKYGWTEGKGLGKDESGISSAIRVKLKFDNGGVGYKLANEYSNTWWTDMHQNKLNDTKTTNGKYDLFIKTAKLTMSGTERLSNTPDPIAEPLKTFSELTDDQLFAACRHRTAHKGARHGLNLGGKLSRIEKQEKLLLKKMKKMSLTDSEAHKTERKLRKLSKHKTSDFREHRTSFSDDSVASNLSTKKKKRKSVSFNEVITKIYTSETTDGGDNGMHNENSNDAMTINSSCSDEGIGNDVENNDKYHLDNHKAFEEARLNFNDLSKAEKKKLRKKRKQHAKLTGQTTTYLETVAKKSQELKKIKASKKRKHLDEPLIHMKRVQCEQPIKQKKKKHKIRKKHRNRDLEAKVINSITESLETVCRV